MAEETDSGRVEPGSGSTGAQRFFARAVFVFFDKPFRFLLPAIIITTLGVYSAATKPDEFRSIGVVSAASETFLDTLSGTNDNSNTFDTPAATAARQFNELMQTDGFVATLIDGAGLSEQRQNGAYTVETARANVYAAAAGDSLVNVVGVAGSPDEARLLAASAIASFKNFIISSQVEGTAVAETFYDEQLSQYKLEVDAASADLRNYLAEHPEPINPGDERDIGEQLEIEKLNDLLGRAQDRFDSVFDNREAARLATLQSSADINERFRTLDEPVQPILPESGLTTLATTVILFGVLGLMISVGAVVMVSLVDRSIYSADDLNRLGAPVRAVVPRSKGMRIDQLGPVAQLPPRAEAPIRSAS